MSSQQRFFRGLNREGMSMCISTHFLYAFHHLIYYLLFEAHHHPYFFFQLCDSRLCRRWRAHHLYVMLENLQIVLHICRRNIQYSHACLTGLSFWFFGNDSFCGVSRVISCGKEFAVWSNLSMCQAKRPDAVIVSLASMSLIQLYKFVAIMIEWSSLATIEWSSLAKLLFSLGTMAFARRVL